MIFEKLLQMVYDVAMQFLQRQRLNIDAQSIDKAPRVTH